MKNKILIKLYIPEYELSYDLFIPANEFIWKVKEIIIKSLNDLENLKLDPKESFILINKDNGTIYDVNELVSKTDIRNATELLFVSN